MIFQKDDHFYKNKAIPIYMELSAEQAHAILSFRKGLNLFITGPGGSGKTALIHCLVVDATNRNKKLQVCALTGCAALLLGCKGAKTIHSWSGIGLGHGKIEDMTKRVVNNRYRCANWRNTDILIIDEVSMMSKKLFNTLDEIGRATRQNDLPFGGIQVIFSGDFFQLPPVGDVEELDTSAFCFESEKWSTTFQESIQLHKIFRQTDKEFSLILNQLRMGKLSPDCCKLLHERVNYVMPEASIVRPTILLPRRKDVDAINTRELGKLQTDELVYEIENVSDLPIFTRTKMNVSESQEKVEFDSLRRNVMAESKIRLKIGAQVMCIANIDTESDNPIVNGSQGVITEFKNGIPIVTFRDGHDRQIGYHTWASDNIPHIGIKQIPLIHAWAITIHKAQGVTLELAQIDAGNNVFECGQIYVALSRVKTLNGLFLTAFDPSKLKVNKRVVAFYASLDTKHNNLCSTNVNLKNDF